MRVANVLHDSTVDGVGLRTVVFFQGCSYNCPGCHNPESHSKRKGHRWSPEKLLEEVSKGGISGKLTLSGGEPLEQDHEQLIEFIKLYKKRCKEAGIRSNIWIYSGKKYTFEDLSDKSTTSQILKMCNYLVDGPFVLSLKKELPFRGSSNQRIINLKKTYGAKKIVVDKKLMNAK